MIQRKWLNVRKGILLSRLFPIALFFCGIVLLLLISRIYLEWDGFSSEVYLPTNSTVNRLLARYPKTLNFNDLRQKLSSDYFVKRSIEFAKDTRGILRNEIAVAQDKGLCPKNGSEVDVIADKELGYTLEAYLGQAYYLHLIDCLQSTSGYEGSKPFFFFNPEHQVLNPDTEGTHIWDFRVSFNPWNAFAHSWEKLTEHEKTIYWNPVRSPIYPIVGLKWPPFSSYYENQFMMKLKRMKRVAIVAGKHYVQWSGAEPINTFAQPRDLRQIFDVLLDNGYVIVYNRVRVEELKVADTDRGAPLDPKDYEMIYNEYSERDVITMEHLWMTIYPDVPMLQNPSQFNIFQLLIYQQADLFVDTQGGGAVVSSLMPGDHFILHRQGSELIKPPEEADSDAAWVYHRWWRHGGGRFFVHIDVEDLVNDLRGVTHAYGVLKRPKAQETR